MARAKIFVGIFALSAAMFAASAPAQIGPLYPDEAPRPPADVRDAPLPPRYPVRPAPRPAQGQPNSWGQDQVPVPPAAIGDDPNVDEPDDPATEPADTTPDDDDIERPSSRLPGQPRDDGAIQSQDLAPLPGTTPPPASDQSAPAVSEPGQSQPAIVRTTPGLPPGIRQPSRELQDNGQPADAVVIAPPPMPIRNPTVVFAGLDKITGRIISFDVAIDETVQFGALQVTPRVCYSRPPTETPRTDAFVEVDEVTLKGEIKRIFNGWMFAASPGLHAVEHPIYDVWLTDCKGAETPAVAQRVNDQKTSRRHATPKRSPRARQDAQRRLDVLPPPPR